MVKDGKNLRHRKAILGESQMKMIQSNADTLDHIDTTVGLKKTVSLMGGIALIAGTMIGSGIFVSPKGVLEDTGSVGLSLIIWTCCGILSMLGALAYAELGACITKSGGEWIYINEAYAPLHPILGELPAFLFAWMSVVVLKPASVAAIALVFSEYIMTPFFDDCGPPELILKLLTAVTIIFMAALNIYSVKGANRVQILFFLVKLAALVGIIVGGFYRMGKGDTKHLKSGFEGTVSSPSAIARAFYKGLWAYDGWNNLNYVTEELKNPKQNIVLCICISIPLVTVVYLLANISYFTVLSPTALLDSEAVAVDWALLVLPSATIAITLCVAFSTFGSANGTLIGGSRFTYAAARGGHLMSMLSMVDVNYNSPSTSIVLTTIIAILMIIPSNIFALIDFFSFTAWIFYGLTMSAFLILRWKQPHLERPFKCPIIIPIVVLIISIYLVFAPIIDSPDMLYLYATIFLFAGMIFYFPFVAFKKEIKCFDYCTVFAQKLMQVVPAETESGELIDPSLPPSQSTQAEIINSTDDKLNQDDAAVGLKKTVSLLGGIALIAGTMIGSGIFVSPKGVLEDTGSVGLCLIVWACCGLISMLGALAYAELGSCILKSGGEWVYIYEAYAPLHSRLGELPSFLFSWMSVIVLKPSSVAIIASAFAEYIMTPFFDDCGPPKMLLKMLTAVTIMFMAALNIYSVKGANRVQILFFLVKLAALVGIVVGGFYQIGKGDTKHLKTGFEGTVSSPLPVARAFYKGLWAFDGWNNLNYVTEELKNPKRNVPLSIAISIPLVTIVYLLTNISYFTVLSPAALLDSEAVAVDWAALVLPSAVIVVTLCVALSTFGAANGSLIGGSRLAFAAARGGHLMSMFSMVDVNYNSPSSSIVITSVIAILMVIPADIFTLIDFFSFTAWIFYGLTMSSLLILRWKRPDLERPFKCPIVIPIVVLIISIYLVFAPIIDSPDMLYLYATIFLFAGLIFYFPFVAFKKEVKAFDHCTLFVQRLMQIVPNETVPED